MARAGEIDPWNIDIINVTDKFLERLVERERVDLRASARTLLYASILLRMKSDVLVNVPQPEPEDDYVPDFEPGPEDFPVLEPGQRHAGARPVTLQELISELQRAVATKDASHMRKSLKIEKPPRKTIEEVLSIAHNEDIEKGIVDMIGVLDAEFAYRDFVLFSELVKDQSPCGIVDAYLPLLFLANRRQIMLTQEVLFEEMFIRRPKPDG